MSAEASLTPLHAVTMLYLATSPEPKRTITAARKAIAAWLPSTETDWAGVFDDLVSRQLASRRGRAGVDLTDLGRSTVAAYLGMTALPANLRWAAARDKLLVGHALGVSPSERKGLSKADVLVGAIVARKEALPVAAGAGAARVRDALVGRRLGMEPTQRLTLEGIRKAALEVHLGGARAQDSKSLMRQLAARHAGARSTSSVELQRSVLRSWLAGGTHDAGAEDPLKSFASQVTNAASRSPTGRFGDSKIFVSHVWRELQKSAPVIAGSLSSFKERLLAANRAQHLALARADLVSVMDPADVAESEISDSHSCYHFVVVPLA